MHVYIMLHYAPSFGTHLYYMQRILTYVIFAIYSK